MADDVFAVPSSDEEVSVGTKATRTYKKKSRSRTKQSLPQKTSVGADVGSAGFISIMNKADDNTKRRRVAVIHAVSPTPTRAGAPQPDDNAFRQHAALESAPVCNITPHISRSEHDVSLASRTQTIAQPQVIRASMSELPAPLCPVGVAEKSSSPLAGRAADGAPLHTNGRPPRRGTMEKPSLRSTLGDDRKRAALRETLPASQKSYPSLRVTPPVSALTPVKRKHSLSSSPPPGDMPSQTPTFEQPPRDLATRSKGLWHKLFEAEHTVGQHDLTHQDRSTEQGNRKDRLEQQVITKVLPKQAADSIVSSDTHLKPRRRLIDSLVEQASPATDCDPRSNDPDNGSLPSGDSVDVIPMQAPPITMKGVPSLEDELRAAPGTLSRMPSLQESSTQGSQNVGPKITYLRPNRTVVQEASFETQLVPGTPPRIPDDAMLAGWRQSKKAPLATGENATKSINAEMHDEAVGQTIRSIHELRQGGANKRFVESVEALLDDIGTPTITMKSRRRSALLDLASKATEKGFCRHFLDNDLNHRLVLRIGQEMDMISGFAIVSLISALLTEGAALHTIAQIRDEGINDLLGRMLDSAETIHILVKQRRTNMSKVAQSLVLEYEVMLLSTTLWAGVQVEELSPQMTALKCLETLILKTREAGSREDILSEELTQKLFNILRMALKHGWWDEVMGCSTTIIHLVLSILESHSIHTKDIGTTPAWTLEYLPLMVKTLTKAINRPHVEFSMSQTLALRWTLNMTVHRSQVSDAFAQSDLLVPLGRVIVEGFTLISSFLPGNQRQSILDNLVLTLAVMINLAEYSITARKCMQGLSGSSHDPLEGMLQIFIDRQESIAEVSGHAKSISQY